MATDDFASLRGAWLTHPDIDALSAELSREGVLTASLNWYRANIPARSLIEPAIELPPIAAPTMGVWSTADRALTEAQMTGSAQFVAARGRYERIEGAGHWTQLERPEQVNALLLDFLPTP